MAEDIIDILVTNYNDNVTLELDPAVTVVNISNLSGLTGIIIPSGTIGRLPYYDTASTFSDSNIYTTGTIVGINNDTPTLYSTNKGMVVRNPAGNTELLLQHDGNTANSIQGLSISTVKADAAYIFQRENLPLKIGTNDTSRIFISGGGNVGIGTTSPTTKVDISYADNAYLAGLTVTNTTNGAQAQSKINIVNSAGTILSLMSQSPSVNGGTSFITTSDTTPLVFGVQYLEKMRITSTGNVGIGTSSPTNKLSVIGSANINNYLLIDSSQSYFGDSGLIAGGATDGNTTIQYYTTKNLYIKQSGFTRATLDLNGNLGLSVTPSAWGSSRKAFEFGNIGKSLSGGSNVTEITLGGNAYDATGGWTYANAGHATLYQQYNGFHAWLTAPSGTAGTAITFTQAMTLDASGNLYIGKTTGVSRFGISGLPTSASGLASGDIWNDSGTLKIV